MFQHKSEFNFRAQRHVCERLHLCRRFSARGSKSLDLVLAQPNKPHLSSPVYAPLLLGAVVFSRSVRTLSIHGPLAAQVRKSSQLIGTKHEERKTRMIWLRLIGVVVSWFPRFVNDGLHTRARQAATAALHTCSIHCLGPDFVYVFLLY